MRIGVFSWLVGLVVLTQLPQLPSPLVLFLFPFLVIGGLRSAIVYWRVLAWLGAGLLWGCGTALLTDHERLDSRWVGETISLTGQIASVSEIVDGTQHFNFIVESVILPIAVSVPHKIRLSWRLPKQNIVPGQRWQLAVRLKPPHRYANPGSFDREAWLWQQHIGATGYVRNEPDSVILTENTGDYPVQRFRHQLAKEITRVLGDNQTYTKVIIALVLGIQANLDQQDWQRLRNTGTSHLLAISGLHIGMVASLCYLIALWIARQSVWLTQRIAAPRMAAILGAISAIGYATLAGFSIPTQRACLMICVGFAGIYFNTRRSPSEVLALVLGIILIWDPFAILSAGFWLSFGAVAIIYFILVGGAQRDWPRWQQSMRTQWFISLGLVPLLIVFFGQIPLYSPVVNLVAIPLVTLVIVPILLTGTASLVIWPWLSSNLLGLGAQVISLLWWLLDWFAALPYANIALPQVTVLTILLVASGLILLALPRGLSCRWLGLLVFTPLCFPVIPQLASGEVRLTLLDVGQGLSLVAETQHHVLVFDTGPRFSSDFNLGEVVIAPFLRQRGWNRIDQLVVSHGDLDHIGGAEGLAHQLPIQHILSSVPELLSFMPVQRCEAGQHWQWDGVNFEILHPLPDDYFTNRKGNNRCCVLQISTGQRRALFTADIEALAEQQLLDRYGTSLASDVLLIPHHGSRTSSTPDFLQVTQPRYAWVATGQFNRFHFPREDVLLRFRERGIRVYDTAREGAISMILGPGGLLDQPEGFRQQQRRLWHVRE